MESVSTTLVIANKDGPVKSVTSKLAQKNAVIMDIVEKENASAVSYGLEKYVILENAKMTAQAMVFVALIKHVYVTMGGMEPTAVFNTAKMIAMSTDIALTGYAIAKMGSQAYNVNMLLVQIIVANTEAVI